MLKWVGRALFILGVVLIFWLLWGGSHGVCPGLSEPQLEEVAELTGIDFPHSAKLLGAVCYACFQAREMRASVRIDREDLDETLNSIPVEEQDTTTDDSYRQGFFAAIRWLREMPAWWHPELAETFAGYSRVYTGSEPTVLLLVHLDDEATPVIYIYWAR
ncbi:MAG: hypothetical protein KAW89_04085 [Armatimonadetes bacterium]|nr:hypothetical protein [Armatimonadota bacterium]